MALIELVDDLFDDITERPARRKRIEGPHGPSRSKGKASMTLTVRYTSADPSSMAALRALPAGSGMRILIVPSSLVRTCRAGRPG